MLYLDTRLSGTLYSNTQYCILNTPVLFYEIIPGLLKGSLGSIKRFASHEEMDLSSTTHTEYVKYSIQNIKQ